MTQVSVLIPTYNRIRFINEAIRSVLEQTFSEYEIIVVDDGSKDKTGEILRKKYGDQIRYFYQRHHGLSVARNKGILEARGEYIAFLDSDDLFLPKKLEKQVVYFEKHPAAGLLYTNYYKINQHGRNKSTRNPRYYKNREEAKRKLLKNCYITATSTVMVRKDCFSRAGLFNPQYKVSGDYDMWLRILHYDDLGYLKVPLAKYRKHDHNRNSKKHNGVYTKEIQNHARRIYGTDEYDCPLPDRGY